MWISRSSGRLPGKRGHSDDDLRKIRGGSMMRVWKLFWE